MDNLWSENEIHNMGYGKKKISDLPNEQILKQVILLLLTVNTNENNAVLCYLEPLTSHKDIYKYIQQVDDHSQSQSMIYYIGNYGKVPTAVRQITSVSEFGDVSVTTYGLDFSCFKNLNAIIWVGIICGVETHVKICDVLVANEIIDFDLCRLSQVDVVNSGKSVPLQLISVNKENKISTSEFLSSLFKQKDVNWPDDEIKERLVKCHVPKPKLRHGIIVSVPNHIHNNNTKDEMLREIAPEAIGIEMERAYLHTSELGLHLAIVKAVYDYGGDTTNKIFQPTAALLAANCLKMYLDDPQITNRLCSNQGRFK